jgi:hypothetical protein
LHQVRLDLLPQPFFVTETSFPNIIPTMQRNSFGGQKVRFPIAVPILHGETLFQGFLCGYMTTNPTNFLHQMTSTRNKLPKVFVSPVSFSSGLYLLHRSDSVLAVRDNNHRHHSPLQNLCQGPGFSLWAVWAVPSNA